MAEIGKWNGHSFVVSPTLIRSFVDLTLRGSSETENKTSGGQSYVARKSGAPMEISLTVQLNAAAGCDVYNEAKKFVSEARSGAKNYFYLGGKKLAACKFMLTEASVTETEIAPGGKWVSCAVKLSMKQSSKNDGSASGSSKGSKKSGGSKKTSVRKKKTTTTSKTSNIIVAGAVLGTAAAGAVTLVKKASSALKGAVSRVNSVINGGKKASAASKQKGSASSKVGVGSRGIAYKRFGA